MRIGWKQVRWSSVRFGGVNFGFTTLVWKCHLSGLLGVLVALQVLRAMGVSVLQPRPSRTQLCVFLGSLPTTSPFRCDFFSAGVSVLLLFFASEGIITCPPGVPRPAEGWVCSQSLQCCWKANQCGLRGCGLRSQAAWVLISVFPLHWLRVPLFIYLSAGRNNRSCLTGRH